MREIWNEAKQRTIVIKDCDPQRFDNRGHYFVDGKCVYCDMPEPILHSYLTNKPTPDSIKEREESILGHYFPPNKTSCKYCGIEKWKVKEKIEIRNSR